jgi:HSP20 family molecular chaperone IbpA
MEIEDGPFQRRITLAEDVDPNGGEATYDRGLLTIVLPLAPKPPVGSVTIVLGRRRAT